MPELVLYGIRLLAKQLLGTVLDMEVDHWTSLLHSRLSLLSPIFQWTSPACWRPAEVTTRPVETLTQAGAPPTRG